MAEARPKQSYTVAVLAFEVTVTALHRSATIVSAVRLPVRVSPGLPRDPSPTIHRSRPVLIACAIQAADTELSRPEKPPRPAMFALAERISVAALL
jgi:hypothetical protein